MKRRVAIVGGGLAGIAAALRLAEADATPVVIESRKQLGGRATSFVDPRTGHALDNCQHVLMGCCTNLLDLYARIGVDPLIAWHTEYPWTAGRGVIDTLRPGCWPAPFHLAGSLRRMETYDAGERRAIARGMWRILRLGASGRLTWRDRTFDRFLAACGQPAGVVSRFWTPIIVSACNLAVDRVSAAVALKVLQDGFLASRVAPAMGVPTVTLGALYAPAADAIREVGGEVRLGTSARAIGYDGRRVTGVVTEEGLVEASAVVSAVTPDRLDKLVSKTLRTADRRLQGLDEIETSPILAVHLFYEDEVMPQPHLVVVDHGVQWLFNKGRDADGRQHVHAVISAADAWMALDEGAIVERVTQDIERLLPAARGRAPVAIRAVKEKRATFAATPAFETRRPAAAGSVIGLGEGGVKNLLLAGDWCDTGWPATMEGAVRSGYAAAAAWTGEGGPVEDLPPSWLTRLLSR